LLDISESKKVSKLENERMRELENEVRGRSTTGGVNYTGEGNEKIRK